MSVQDSGDDRNRPSITNNNLNPAIQLITWLLIAAVLLAIVFRLLTKLYLRDIRRFAYDDLLVFLAFCFGLGQSITLLIPSSQAWGQSATRVDAKLWLSGLKTRFVGDILLIFSLCLAKLSVCSGLLSITPVKWHRIATFASSSCVLIWAFTSIFLIAFQCGLPDPWNYVERTCLNRRSIANYIAIVNLLSDLVLVVLPTAVIWPLQMAFKRKLAFLLLFWTRILTVVTIAFQLAYLPRAFGSDVTWRIFPYIICTQIVQAGSIITACIPYLKPFMESLQSGLFWISDVERLEPRRQTTTAYSSKFSTQADSHRSDYVELRSLKKSGSH